MKVFTYAEAISAIENPLDWSSEKNEIFYKACVEMATFHYESNSVIKCIYDKRRFKPTSICSEADLARIPSLGVTAMKYHLLTSMDHKKSILQLTSSGTRGQKTQIWFDQGSLDRVQKMMDVYFEQEGFVSSEPNNYIIFNYDPEDAGDLGIAYSDKNQMRFAPVADSYFAIKKNEEGNWTFDKQAMLAKLHKFESTGLPLRIFAMPAFLHEFLVWMQETKQRSLAFPKSSWILTGGGWKAAEDKKITREMFRSICEEIFSIPSERQRDGFGMAEHCAPYFECRHHRLHIPVYNRILVRDPITNCVLPDGEVGVMEFITPFNTMMPTLAINSTDYGRIRKTPCDCGFSSPTFEVLGRAGLSKHKGCALTASEIVRRL